MQQLPGLVLYIELEQLFGPVLAEVLEQNVGEEEAFDLDLWLVTQDLAFGQ